jgi:hypothetical protein
MERTGGKRYAKKISYTQVIDLIDAIVSADDNYKKVLNLWLNQKKITDESLGAYERKLIRFLTALNEECVYRIRTNENGMYTFRNYGIYDALSSDSAINITDAKEQVGTLRILSSIVNDNLNYYLQKDRTGLVRKDESVADSELVSYSQRVKNYISLSSVRITNSDENEGTNNGDQPPLPHYDFQVTNGGAENIVVYGTPGCGKSYYVENKLLADIGVSQDNRIRTTFFLDYTNTDFVGQILPRVYSDKSVTYEFNPGPFTIALRKAIENPRENVALIIEELNRGNAASIFGDIFQLLDRSKKTENRQQGQSVYDITNVNIQGYLNSIFAGRYVFDKISIPGNLYIVATMNTSDQNVFTLDTAFKRRWQFEKLKNYFKDDHKYKDYLVPGMNGVTWEKLVNDLNTFIVNNATTLSSEDKQIGVYFVTDDMLCKVDEEATEDKKKKFAYKLLEYLWDDVAKFAREDWFGSDIKSLDQLIEQYMVNGERVFSNGIIK